MSKVTRRRFLENALKALGAVALALTGCDIKPSPESESTKTPTPTSTPTPEPSPTPTSTPTPEPSPTPTSTPTPEPSPTPTSTLTNDQLIELSKELSSKLKPVGSWDGCSYYLMIAEVNEGNKEGNPKATSVGIIFYHKDAEGGIYGEEDPFYVIRWWYEYGTKTGMFDLCINGKGTPRIAYMTPENYIIIINPEFLTDLKNLQPLNKSAPNKPGIYINKEERKILINGPELKIEEYDNHRVVEPPIEEIESFYLFLCFQAARSMKRAVDLGLKTPEQYFETFKGYDDDLKDLKDDKEPWTIIYGNEKFEIGSYGVFCGYKAKSNLEYDKNLWEAFKELTKKLVQLLPSLYVPVPVIPPNNYLTCADSWSYEEFSSILNLEDMLKSYPFNPFKNNHIEYKYVQFGNPSP
ncbi:MAG: hypothetical protein QXM68_03650 [Candidatus Aenigmatarchaeota archaeon]|nr:hypothetical protein [Candidatus Aenigmarchaeota archaeon]